MDNHAKEIALKEIMAQFETSWENILLSKEELSDEEALNLKSSVLDTLNNITLHDYLNLLPASVLATLTQHTIERFTKYHILNLLKNIFSYRVQKGQIFLINHHEITFNYGIKNHVLAVHFSVIARERLPGFIADIKQVQMNPYEIYYTRIAKKVTQADYAWGGLLYVPATMLNFNENEIKMWKLSGKQIEFTELELSEMLFESTEKITFKDMPEAEDSRPLDHWSHFC